MKFRTFAVGSALSSLALALGGCLSAGSLQMSQRHLKRQIPAQIVSCPKGLVDASGNPIAAADIENAVQNSLVPPSEYDCLIAAVHTSPSDQIYQRTWALSLSADQRQKLIDSAAIVLASPSGDYPATRSGVWNFVSASFLSTTEGLGTFRFDARSVDFSQLSAELNTKQKMVSRSGYPDEATILSNIQDWTGNTYATLEDAATGEGYSNLISFMGDWFSAAATFSYMNFKNVDLRNANFAGLDLSGTKFSEARVEGADFAGSICNDCKFLDSDVGGAQIQSLASRYAIDLSGLDLSGLDLSGLDLTSWNLSHVTGLDGADLNSAANLSGANLTGLDLDGFDPTGRNLSGIDFTDTVNLDASKLHLASSLTSTKLVRVDLTGFNPSGKSISGINFTGSTNMDTSLLAAATNITSCNFTGMNLSGLSLTGKDLSNVVLDNVTGLTGAQLKLASKLDGVSARGFDMTGFSASGLALKYVTFKGALNFTGSMLNNATVLQSANFEGLDLSGWTVGPTAQGGAFGFLNLNGTTFGGDVSVFRGIASSSPMVLRGTTFAGADLTGYAPLHDNFFANYSGVTSINGSALNSATRIIWANMGDFDMTGFNFTTGLAGSDLRFVKNMSGAQLANLSKPGGLVHSDLCVNVQGRNLSGFSGNGFFLKNCNFSGVTGITAADLNGATSYEGVNFGTLSLTGFNPSGKTLLNAVLPASISTPAAFVAATGITPGAGTRWKDGTYPWGP
jgi:uncharacterized protein YjbI with pentapeptide repeats